MNNYDMQDLKLAIAEKDYRGVVAILRSSPELEPNKEILSLAISSKHSQILKVIVDKTDVNIFDKDIVKQAIETNMQAIVAPVVKKTPSDTLDKDIILKAISTKDSSIVYNVASKIDKRHIDKEVVDVALETKIGRVIRPVLEKADSTFFDKNFMLKIMEMKDDRLSDLVVKKTPKEHFDREVLHKSFATGSFTVVTSVVSKTPSQEFDDETLNKALDTKNGNVLHAVAQKTDKKYFNEDTLKKAIDTKLDSIVRVIVQKIDPKFLNKEIVKLSVDTNVPKIVYAIGNYSKPECFDKEILERALAKNNPDLVRSVVDYTKDKEVLFGYKDKIQKAILKSSDIRNLTAQILSRRDNQSFDREMQELVLDIYLDVIQEHFKKTDIPKGFPMKEFEDSIKDSRYYFSNPEKVNFDSLDKSNRFLILPVFSYGHAFSTIARKLDDGKISLTFVNLGARPFERDRSGNQYKEFVYTKEKALKVLHDHSFSVRLHYPQKAVDTQQAYKNFGKEALESYTLNVTSRDQKVGNCFTKNIEKGVRYALALGLSKTENKNFDPNDLRVSVEDGGKYKVKFLKPIHKAGDKTNDLSTVELRRELINKILERFPEYEKDIMAEWKIYENRKEKTQPKPEPNPQPLPDVVIYGNKKIASRYNGKMLDSMKMPLKDNAMVNSDFNRPKRDFVAKMNDFAKRDSRAICGNKELRSM